MSKTKDIIIPSIGDYHDLPVIEILVAAGDSINEGQSILVLESDKATIEVPSPLSGIIESISVTVGTTVSAGICIGKIKSSSTVEPAKSLSPKPSEEKKLPVSKPTEKKESTKTADSSLPYASPLIRQFARDNGVNINEINGTGKNGRIIKNDIEKTINKGGTSTFHNSENTEIRLQRSRIQKLSAEFLSKSWTTIPHVTNCEDADITDLEEFRKQLNQKYKSYNVKLTVLSFLIKACAAGLKEFPKLNSSLDGDELVLKKEYNIGVIVDTPQGLIAPVIKNADRYGLIEISKQLSLLSEKARSGKISPADLEGGTFSISSLGGIGGTYFTPIIRAPEVAILGACRSKTQPVWDGQTFQPRLILPMSLSWDHRVVDGVMAAKFNLFIKEVIEDLRLLNI